MAGLRKARVQPRLFKRVWLSGNLRVFLGREQVITKFSCINMILDGFNQSVILIYKRKTPWVHFAIPFPISIIIIFGPFFIMVCSAAQIPAYLTQTKQSIYHPWQSADSLIRITIS